MSYSLLKDEVVVCTQSNWNPSFFEYFLNELGFLVDLPDSPITEPLLFSDNVKLLLTIDDGLPEFNSLFETLAGPNYKYDDLNNFHSYFVVQELELNQAKNNVRSVVTNNRWVKENTNIDRIIGSYSLTLYTDRGSRTSYTQALVGATEEYSAIWKFPQGFFTLNKQDLQQVANEVLAYVQSCFDWEASKNGEIDSSSTIEELKQIILE